MATGVTPLPTAPKVGWRSRKSGAPIQARPLNKAYLLSCFLERLHRPRADLLDDDAGCKAAELAAILERASLRIAEEETGGEEIAGTGRIDNFADLDCIDVITLGTLD